MTQRSAASFAPDYAPHARAERLIAVGRLVLAVASLAAVYLEPSTPAQYQQATYSMLVVYTVYAAAMAVFAWRSPVPRASWRLISHAADLVLFSVFVYLTEGPASPFFLYFVFSLFSATLRFSWKGILRTGIAAIAIYGLMAAFASFTAPDFDASRAVTRLAYLGVITALLVYLGVYQQQLRTELAALAAWPRELAAARDEVLRSALRHSAAVMRAERVLLLWEEHEEPWVYCAVHDTSGFRVERLPPLDGETAGATLRVGAAFARPDRGGALAYDRLRQSVTETEVDPLGERVRERYGVAGAIVVSLSGETLEATLVVPDLRAATTDDLALAHVTGRLVLATLEQFLFVQQVRQNASAEERLRISRDLHDGIVQSLAGAGLALESLRGRVAADPAISAQLARLQEVLEQDQRELRSLVRELRLHDARDGWSIFTDDLQRMRERYPLEWGLEIELEALDTVPLTPALGRELCRILNESLSNAARHGAATRACVSVRAQDGTLQLHVQDNGRGFPFTGRYQLDALERNDVGPRTLKERVRKLAGQLTVQSSPHGAAIEMQIPLRPETD